MYLNSHPQKRNQCKKFDPVQVKIEHINIIIFSAILFCRSKQIAKSDSGTFGVDLNGWPGKIF